jgi:hypothetical protein
MVRSSISDEGEVWMNTDVRELSFNETENGVGSPFDGPAVDVQLKDDNEIIVDDEFDDKTPDELEDDDFEDDELDLEDFEDDVILDDDDDDDDLDDFGEDEF